MSHLAQTEVNAPASSTSILILSDNGVISAATLFCRPVRRYLNRDDPYTRAESANTGCRSMTKAPLTDWRQSQGALRTSQASGSPLHLKVPFALALPMTATSPAAP